jgi:ribosomal protein S18 acetylase RimI-like enzyme
MYIGKVSKVTEELHAALKRLVPQLGPHKTSPTFEELNKLVISESSTLLVARQSSEEDPIVGILCLTIYRVPTGLRSLIEDVIVDENARRQGIGEALVRYAIDLAKKAGADGVSLTSNPQLRRTNPYFYKLK